MHTEAHLFSVPNDYLWYDKLWGPSQRVVTLFHICEELNTLGESRCSGYLAQRAILLLHAVGLFKFICVVGFL